MTKNPFEIRAEMLQLAKDYMDKQQALNVDFMEKAFEEGKKTFDEYQATATQMYSMDELMEKAKEMYSFVSNKGDDK
jgi:Tfp pilus assembly protein PilF